MKWLVIKLRVIIKKNKSYVLALVLLLVNTGMKPIKVIMMLGINIFTFMLFIIGVRNIFMMLLFRKFMNIGIIKLRIIRNIEV